MKKIKVGVKGVDSVLYGGFPKGKVILLSGNCGAGKTIFASQFINEGIKGKEPGLYVSLEQEKKRLVADLEELNIHWAQHIEDGKLEVIGGNLAYIRRLKEKRKAGMEDFISEIVEVSQEIGAKRIAIDSVNLFLSLFESEKEKRNVLTELVYQLQDLGATILLTCEIPEDTKSLSWYGFEEFVADGVILLRRTKNITDKRGQINKYRRTFEVIKIRGSDYKWGDFPFKITQDGIIVYSSDPNQEFFS
jgi:circadian clock protein KaiC